MRLRRLIWKPCASAEDVAHMLVWAAKQPANVYLTVQLTLVHYPVTDNYHINADVKMRDAMYLEWRR